MTAQAVVWAPIGVASVKDQSIGTLCLGGPRPGTYTAFPWDSRNTLRGAAAIIAVQETTDPETGLPVDGFAG